MQYFLELAICLTNFGEVFTWVQKSYLASLSVNRWTLCTSSGSLGSNTITQWKFPSPTWPAMGPEDNVYSIRLYYYQNLDESKSKLQLLTTWSVVTMETDPNLSLNTYFKSRFSTGALIFFFHTTEWHNNENIMKTQHMICVSFQHCLCTQSYFDLYKYLLVLGFVDYKAQYGELYRRTWNRCLYILGDSRPIKGCLSSTCKCTRNGWNKKQSATIGSHSATDFIVTTVTFQGRRHETFTIYST